MSRNDLLYLNDILKATERINNYVTGITLDQFKADNLVVDGVLFNLMTIGEAVKNIPDHLRERAPEIRWRDIGRFRDRVVHHYFSLDLDIVWEIVTLHLPPLQTYVEQILKELRDNGGETPK
jgi:uncharacterized protein with HEPN domain